MQVETYEATEIAADLKPECDAEAIALIEKMGLKGQRRLLSASEDGPVKRSPYRKMTRQEQQVYTLLMPKVVTLEDYEDGPVPLRVLQVAAHARELGLNNLLVMCPETGPKDDPVLVHSGHGRFLNGDLLILARWGDALKPFSELVALAATKARDEVRMAAEKALGEAQAFIASLDRMSGDALLANAVNKPYFWQRP